MKIKWEGQCFFHFYRIEKKNSGGDDSAGALRFLLCFPIMFQENMAGEGEGGSPSVCGDCECEIAGRGRTSVYKLSDRESEIA